MAGSGKIFISHAREDAARCAALVKWLDAWGVDYWLETRTDDVGQLTQNTQMALAESAIFLRICTPAANRSYWMSLELGAFLSLQAEEQRRGALGTRSLVSLILDPTYQRQPFDHSGAIVDATNRPQTAWLADLRAAFGMPPLTGDLPAPAQGEIPVTTVTMTRRRALGIGVATTAALAVAGSTGLLLLERKRTPSTGPTASATPTATPQPKPAFVDPNLAWYYKTGDQIDTIPVVADGVVYFGSDDQTLYVRDAATGTKKWQKTSPVKLSRSVAVGTSLVFVFLDTASAGESGIVGLDIKSGDQKYTISGQFLATPVATNGLLFVGGIGGIPAYSQKPSNSDTQRWVWEADIPAGGSNYDQAVDRVTVADKVVYATTEGGSLYAFDASNASATSTGSTLKGKQLWVYKTGNGIYSGPAIANGTVYVGSDDHYLHAVDAKSGHRKWAFKAGNAVDSSVLVSNGIVYFAANDNVFYAVNASTGAKVWTFKPDGNVVIASGALDSASGKIYVSSQSPYLYVLDPATGQQLHRYQAGGKFNTRATVGNGLVFVGSEDHYLYAFKTV